MNYEVTDPKTADEVALIVEQAAELKPLIAEVGVKGVADIVALIKIILELLAAFRNLRS